MQELWGTWQVGRGRANSNRSSLTQEHCCCYCPLFPLSLPRFLLISPLALPLILCWALWVSGRQMFLICSLWYTFFFPSSSVVRGCNTNMNESHTAANYWVLTQLFFVLNSFAHGTCVCGEACPSNTGLILSTCVFLHHTHICFMLKKEKNPTQTTALFKWFEPFHISTRHKAKITRS